MLNILSQNVRFSVKAGFHSYWDHDNAKYIEPKCTFLCKGWFSLAMEAELES